MNNKISILTRILLFVCGLGLVAVLYTPIWRIDLDAPQYPEGLSLKIHANDIKGDVDIVNGLNHYIGMKTLHTADFPEFTILPYCIIFFSIVFIAAAIANRKRGLYLSFFAFVAFGIIAMADFWKWEYNYGHNLDPHAAIVVPGMAYQPPLIGFKQLLNFGAYSIPDVGGWIFLGCGALLLIGVVLEWERSRALKKTTLTGLAAFIVSISFSSCNTGPEPIQVGKDNCSYCKMTIADPRFGAELVTSTGKIYKFDDIHCMQSFRKEMETMAREDAKIYFTDFCGSHELVEASSSILLKDSEIKCPMQGTLVAFNHADSLAKIQSTYKGEHTNWPVQ